ncbi:complement C1q tumor necrosis factor-related protein 3-like [Rhinoraja longicauda]
MRNLLYLILFYCIYQSSTLDNDLEDWQETPDKEMDVKPLNQAEMPNPKDKNGPCEGKKVMFDVELGLHIHVTKPTESILFDKVNVNIENAYNQSTGKFKTPVNGIYFFSFSSLPYKDAETDVVLMKNGKTVRNIHSSLTCFSSQLAVQNAILKLKIGDSVWVKLENGKLWSRDGSISFLGFLISPM